MSSADAPDDAAPPDELPPPADGAPPRADAAQPADAAPLADADAAQPPETAPPPADGEAAFDPASDPGILPTAAPARAEEPVEEPAAAAPTRLPVILESLLFAADRPLTAVELAELVGEPEVAKVEIALLDLAMACDARGIQLHAVAGGWQFRTHPSSAPWVQRLLAARPVRLTRAQLETLAICAYRQPITRPEIDDIRGVDSGGTLKTLLDRSLVRILGKKEEPGRPMLYGTTREFLEFFHLRDLRDLPTLREFHELTDEHRAQVAALEQAAPPGTVEPDTAAGPVAAVARPFERVDLRDQDLDADLAGIDEMIDAAARKAKAVEAALTPAPSDEKTPT